MFTLNLVKINLPRGKSLKIIPFGDAHEDSELCDVARWENFKRRCREEDDEFTRYIEMGDPNEFASSAERLILSNPKLHESMKKKFEKDADHNTRKFVSGISFMRGKMLGVMEGNHRWDFQDGTTSDQRIAEALDSKFLGSLCCIRLAITQMDRTVNVDIVAHHGISGGNSAGATLNQLNKLRGIFPVADIYMMGHSHDRGIWPKSTLILHNSGRRGKMILKQKRQLLCRTGSFLCGYVDGEESYVADRLYQPCELGTIKLDVRLKRDRSNEEDSTTADIHGYI
jgi:hypothetical protein